VEVSHPLYDNGGNRNHLASLEANLLYELAVCPLDDRTREQDELLELFALGFGNVYRQGWVSPYGDWLGRLGDAGGDRLCVF